MPTTSNSDDDSSNGELEELIQKQTNAKVSITKRIHVIEALVDSNKDETEVSEQISKLMSKLAEASNYNKSIRQLVDGKEEEIEKRTKWLNELEKAVHECITKAENYLTHSKLAMNTDESQSVGDSKTHSNPIEKSIVDIKSATETALLTRITCIKQLIDSKADPNEIQMLSSTLKQKYSEIKKWNESNCKDWNWIEGLELQVDLSMAKAQSYIIRNNQISSSIDHNIRTNTVSELTNSTMDRDVITAAKHSSDKERKSTYD